MTFGTFSVVSPGNHMGFITNQYSPFKKLINRKRHSCNHLIFTEQGIKKGTWYILHGLLLFICICGTCDRFLNCYRRSLWTHVAYRVRTSVLLLRFHGKAQIFQRPRLLQEQPWYLMLLLWFFPLDTYASMFCFPCSVSPTVKVIPLNCCTYMSLVTANSVLMFCKYV